MKLKILFLLFILAFFISGCTEQVPDNQIVRTYNITNNEYYEVEPITFSEENITLRFKDKNTDCYLSGELATDEWVLGDVINGKFELFESNYDIVKSSSYLYLYGKTDSCFGTDENLPFTAEFYTDEINFSEEINYLEDTLNPRWPKYYADIMDFVRPYETEEYVSEMDFTENIEENIDQISKYRIRYRKDSLLFGVSEYWQTPKETLDRGHGDCEDWALATLSMIRNYNSSLKCYNIYWETHLSIFCYFPEKNKYVIYDQDETKFSKVVETSLSLFDKKKRLRQMRNNYFEIYGISPNERRAYAVFNEKDLITFDETEDFIDWMVSLEG